MQFVSYLCLATAPDDDLTEWVGIIIRQILNSALAQVLPKRPIIITVLYIYTHFNAWSRELQLVKFSYFIIRWSKEIILAHYKKIYVTKIHVITDGVRDFIYFCFSDDL